MAIWKAVHKEGKAKPVSKETTVKAKTKTRYRADQPPVYNFTRGSKHIALEAARYDELMKQAILAHEDDWTSKGDTGENYAAT